MIDVLNMIEQLRRGMVESSSSRRGDPAINALMMTGSVEALDELERQIKIALSADYIGELYRTRYEVSGNGAFPVDMLRYTCSWPNGESDAQRIHESIVESPFYNKTYTVSLQKYHRDPTPALGEERWIAKFNWRVLSITGTTLL